MPPLFRIDPQAGVAKLQPRRRARRHLGTAGGPAPRLDSRRIRRLLPSRDCDGVGLFGQSGGNAPLPGAPAVARAARSALGTTLNSKLIGGADGPHSAKLVAREVAQISVGLAYC